MIQSYKNATPATQTKVKAGAGGASIGIVAGTFIVQLLEGWLATDFSMEVEGGIIAIVAGLVGWAMQRFFKNKGTNGTTTT